MKQTVKATTAVKGSIAWGIAQGFDLGNVKGLTCPVCGNKSPLTIRFLQKTDFPEYWKGKRYVGDSFACFAESRICEAIFNTKGK